MSPLGLESLVRLVEGKFLSAKSRSSLLFSDTEVTTIRTKTGIPFQLRYCPALSKKPTAPNPTTSPPVPPSSTSTLPSDQPFDPFKNPHPDLLIARVPTHDPTHYLVLNKYPVIPSHFILATIDYKYQTDLLEASDLEITYACLQAWEQNDPNRRLFAFFNSGPHSGASQMHRHIQFLPLEHMKAETDSSAADWDLLPNLLPPPDPEATQPPTENPLSLPFTHFAAPLSPSTSTSAHLAETYKSLYSLASKRGSLLSSSPPASSNLPISYNLALTTTAMLLLPRRAEGTVLKNQYGKEIGYVALNGTTLGGTLMVKQREEWDLLRQEQGKLDEVLEEIGIERVQGVHL